MFDRHQAEITVMQFTGHSLPVHQSMSVPWDFTLSHIVSQVRLCDFNIQQYRFVQFVKLKKKRKKVRSLEFYYKAISLVNLDLL